MNKKTQINPLEGNVFKGMLIFAFPIAISALLTMLFSCVDSIIIGQFGDENAVAAIGVSSSVISLISGGLTSLAGGVTVVMGQMYGSNNSEKVNTLLHSLPLTALLLGGVISACVIILSSPVLQWLNCPQSIMRDALAYFRIYFLGIPLTILNVFLSAVFQAKGNSYIPFSFQIVAALANAILDVFFIVSLKLNVVGAAAATVLSQLLLSVLLVLCMQKQGNELKMNFKELKLFKGMNEIFSIGIPSSLEGIALNLSGVIISSAINKFDAIVIAGNSIASTIEGLMVITFTGFAAASTVFISQNNGCGNMDRVKKIFVITLVTVFVSAEAVGLILYAASSKLLLLFTNDSAILQSGQLRMRYMCLFFGFCGLMNVISGCERGLGDAKTPLIISILCSVVFRLTWIFTYAAQQGTVSSIYLSYPICWGLCSLLNFLSFIRLYRQKKISLQNKDAVSN